MSGGSSQSGIAAADGRGVSEVVIRRRARTVAHSRVGAFQGLGPASLPRRRLMKTLMMNSKTLMAMVHAPMVAMRLSVPQPVSAW